MKFTLEQVIEVFPMIPEVQDFATPEGAAGNCNDAALAFCTLLRASDIPAYQQQLIRPDSEICRFHIVACVYDLYVDWTARQYDPGAEFPRIVTRQQLEEEGWIFGDTLMPDD